jgi:hypothetical protein
VLPVWPLLESLAEGTATSRRIALVDDAAQVPRVLAELGGA